MAALRHEQDALPSQVTSSRPCDTQECPALRCFADAPNSSFAAPESSSCCTDPRAGMDTTLTLPARYAEACERHGVGEHKSICAAFAKMRLLSSEAELEVILDQMTDSDALPVFDLLAAAARSSELVAVDITLNNATCSFDGFLLLQLLRAAGSKLRTVDLRNTAFGKDSLRDLFQGELRAASLDLSLCRVRKMDMTGQFAALHTLKLDYTFAVTSLPEGCFRGMPNLARLSMCGTRIANLWTTCAALAKLPHLVELRFQKCLCCQGTGQCARASGVLNSPLQKESWQRQPDTKQNMDWSPTTTGDEYDSVDMDPSDFSRTEDEESDNVFSDDDSTLHTQVNMSTEEHTLEGETDRLGNGRGTNANDSAQDDEENDHREDMAFRSSDASSESTSGASEPHMLEGSSVGTSAQTEDLELTPMDSLLAVVDYHSSQQQGSEDSMDPDPDELKPSGTTTAPGHRLIDQSGNIERVDFGVVHHRAGGGAITEGGCSSGDEEEGPDVLHLGLRGVHHASPICFERHYREFMVASLNGLQVLDNLSISDKEKVHAQHRFSEHFERMANNRDEGENVLAVLKRREMGGWGCGGTFNEHRRPGSGNTTFSTAAYCRSLCAAKMASCTWPATTPICRLKKSGTDVNRRCRPRQFEYHPTEPAYMVFGTLHGEVVVVNHESDKVVGYVQSIGAPHSILGLCWLNKDPSKLIAGSDNGSLQLYDVNHMHSTVVVPGGRSESRLSYNNRPSSIGISRTTSTCWSTRTARSPTIHTYDDFEQLTSVHINSSDDYFLASGYSKHVGLYDLRTGKRLQIFPDLHQEHINVVKFAHHSAHLFATSSFDKDIKMWDIRQKAVKPLYTVHSVRGNVMVCFSRDDHYLLSSAVDNEVRQHLSADGRLHMKFDIPPTGSSQNYTRSYYMNGRDYIITGSCEENVVRICCAQTGRRLRDFVLEGRGLKNSLYVQSLRGDPFKDFHFSVLVAYNHPHSRSEIVKVNLLSAEGQQRGIESEPQVLSLASMGG